MLLVKTLWHWCGLPLRLAMYLCAFIFGHPMIFTPLVAAGTAALFWKHEIQLGGMGVMVLGLLVMWVAETMGGENNAWPARSPFAPPMPIET